VHLFKQLWATVVEDLRGNFSVGVSTWTCLAACYASSPWGSTASAGAGVAKPQRRE